MGDEDAFLAAIGSAPADHAPRLVYADWLDEKDRSKQAGFIRKVLARRQFSISSRKLESGIDWDWVTSVFPEYRLVLLGFPGKRIFDVLEILLRATGSKTKYDVSLSE